MPDYPTNDIERMDLIEDIVCNTLDSKHSIGGKIINNSAIQYWCKKKMREFIKEDSQKWKDEWDNIYDSVCEEVMIRRIIKALKK